MKHKVSAQVSMSNNQKIKVNTDLCFYLSKEIQNLKKGLK